MEQVRINDIAEVVQMSTEAWRSYLDRVSGHVVHATKDDLVAAEAGRPPNYDTAWQREAFDWARRIVQDDGTRFVALPDRDDTDEWKAMEQFAKSIEDEAQRGTLLGAINGPGAFRYFRDAIGRLNVEEAWGTFQDHWYERIIREWSQKHHIELTR